MGRQRNERSKCLRWDYDQFVGKSPVFNNFSIETISLKDSSRTSDGPSANNAVQEHQEDQYQSSSSSSSSAPVQNVVGDSRPLSASESEASAQSQPEGGHYVKFYFFMNFEAFALARVPADAGSRDSDALPVETMSKMEKDKNEIRSLLGDLPPIAKPRLSKV